MKTNFPGLESWCVSAIYTRVLVVCSVGGRSKGWCLQPKPFPLHTNSSVLSAHAKCTPVLVMAYILQELCSIITSYLHAHSAHSCCHSMRVGILVNSSFIQVESLPPERNYSFAHSVHSCCRGMLVGILVKTVHSFRSSHLFPKRDHPSFCGM